MKKLLLIVGCQGSGKDTIANKLCKMCNLKKLISHTTRNRRKNEDDTHIFIKKEDSQKYDKEKITYTKIGDIEYFATLDQIRESDIYIIDPVGVKNLKNNLQEKFPNEKINIVTCYIHVPKEKRLERVLDRNEGDSIESFEKRYKAEYSQFNEFMENAEYDFFVLNTDNGLNKVVNEIASKMGWVD